MTIDDIKNMNTNILTPCTVADLLSCKPEIIIEQARLDCRQLSFPVSSIGSRTKIPRLAFIAWFEKHLNENAQIAKFKGNDICSCCEKSAKNNVLLWYQKTTKVYLCSEHYLEQCCKRKKDLRKSISVKERNVYEINDNYAKIYVYSTKGEFTGSILIDIEDIEKCKKHRWSIKENKNNYKFVLTDTSKGRISLHRYLLGYNGDKQIDHINRNPLDNRKINLRFVEPVENMANNGGHNTQLYPNGKYKCSFIRYGTRFYLGFFDTKEEAIQAKRKKLEEIEANKEFYLDEFNKRKKGLPKGVYPAYPNKFVSSCVIKGKNYKVGTFDTPEEAKQALDAFVEKINSQR